MKNFFFSLLTTIAATASLTIGVPLMASAAPAVPVTTPDAASTLSAYHAASSSSAQPPNQDERNFCFGEDIIAESISGEMVGILLTEAGEMIFYDPESGEPLGILRIQNEDLSMVLEEPFHL